MLYRTIVVALLLLAGGCAGSFGIHSEEGSKAIQQAKTVGVFSLVGQEFALQKIGMTVFGNELNEVPIEPWGIDDAAASKVEAVLGKRYTVRKIGGVKNFEPKDYEAKLQDFMRSIAASHKCDLYIAITRTAVPFGSNSNQTIAGLGMVEAGGALNPDNVYLFAVTSISIYDGRTFQRLVWQRSGYEVGVPLGVLGISAPYRRLDRSWWPRTPQDVHNARIKTATRALLEESLAKTLPALMRLEPTTPAKGG